MVVEAAIRVAGGLQEKAGAFAAGEIFNARDFLDSLCPDHLQVEISWRQRLGNRADVASHFQLSTQYKKERNQGSFLAL
jgi:hypothetical protein